MKLETKDVAVSIMGRDILKGMSVKVDDHSFTALIGPNGCGKSTFLRTVYRVLKADSGVVYLDGKDMNHISPRKIAQNVSVVSQFNQILFDYSVIDIVLMGRTPHLSFLENEHKHDYNFARESLEQVGMAEYRNRKFHSLSGGEKQRVILARALTQKPNLIILDEPVNHLDIRYQLEILAVIKSLKIGVLAALHDLSLAALYCDYIYMMKKGAVLYQGNPEEVITAEHIKDIYHVNCDIFKSPINQQIMIQYHSDFQGDCI